MHNKPFWYRASTLIKTLLSTTAADNVSCRALSIWKGSLRCTFAKRTHLIFYPRNHCWVVALFQQLCETCFRHFLCSTWTTGAPEAGPAASLARLKPLQSKKLRTAEKLESMSTCPKRNKNPRRKRSYCPRQIRPWIRLKPLQKAGEHKHSPSPKRNKITGRKRPYCRQIRHPWIGRQIQCWT